MRRGRFICPRSDRIRRFAPGVTLLELMIALTVVGLLAAVAYPTYQRTMQLLKVGQAGRDLMQIAQEIERFRTVNFKLPDTLADLRAVPKDPWGHDYQYLNFDSSAPGVKGKIRKDHNLHPLNTEFDLYSMGPDGKSAAPLTAKASRDDVIWARDGGYVGTAADF